MSIMSNIEKWGNLTSKIPLLLPITLVLGLLIITVKIGEWLIGFWHCDSCKKKFWITEEKKFRTIHIGDSDYLGEHKCSKCSLV